MLDSNYADQYNQRLRNVGQSTSLMGPVFLVVSGQKLDLPFIATFSSSFLHTAHTPSKSTSLHLEVIALTFV